MNRVLVWDAPNMDMALSNFYGRTPLASERPRMGKLMNWLVRRCGEEDAPVACVFVNVNPSRPGNPRYHNWLRFLSSRGFYVFAKPKDEEGRGDIDEDMLRFIRQHEGAELREVIIASHDANCFKDKIRHLLQNETAVTVLGFSELANGWGESAQRLFLDIQTVPGIFASPPRRHIDIWSLPDEGAVFPPSGRPRADEVRPRRPQRVAPRALQEAPI